LKPENSSGLIQNQPVSSKVMKKLTIANAQEEMVIVGVLNGKLLAFMGTDKLQLILYKVIAKNLAVRHLRI